uniref:Reverse transcriptase domain-containing protein n=1 Tax=Haemonchus contortus TaxID=6289 RepID=A0A7I4Y976_HAECO
MAICTFNARTLASEACIEDLMMQARKIKYDVIGLTETRRHRPLHAVFETGEELFLGTCDSRGVGGVGVLVNTHLAMNIDSYESLTTRIGRLRSRRCDSIPALTISVAYAPTSSYEEEELEAFYMDLERLYREDHTFFNVIVGDFNAKIGSRRTAEEHHIGTHGVEWNEQGERLSEWTWESPGGQFHNEIDRIIFNRRFCLTDVALVPKFYTGSDHRLLRARFCFSVRGERAMKFRKRSPKTSINWDHFAPLASKWEDSVIDNIDEEYNRLVEHLHDSATKAESLQVAKRRLSSKTLEVIRQRGIARATGNYQQTSELAKLCREAIKEDLKERRAAVMDEAAEAGKSIRKARRSFANYKTKMTSLRSPDGTVLHLGGQWRRSSTTSTRISSTATSTCLLTILAPGPDRIKPEHLKNIPPLIIKTLARLFTRYLSECKAPTSWKTSKTVLLYKKGDLDDIGNYRPICLLSVIFNFSTRVILNRIGRILDEGQPCEQTGFRRGFSTIDHIHTLTRLFEVSREYKMPLCLTFIDLKKAFDTVEAEAVIEALGNQGVPTQYIRMLRQLYDQDFTIVQGSHYQREERCPAWQYHIAQTFQCRSREYHASVGMGRLGSEGRRPLSTSPPFCRRHHIVLITPNIEQAERMLSEFDNACGKVGLRLNLTKTMFMKNGLVPDAPFTLNGKNISECSSYVYLGREVNMMNENDLAPKLCRRKRAAWGAFNNIEGVVKKTKNIRLRAHLFDTAVLPALTYASETWTLRKQDEHAVSNFHVRSS